MGVAWRDGTQPTLLRPRAQTAAVRTLDEYEGKTALAGFGLPIPASARVAPAAAAQTAATIGFPVAMKAASAALAHKSDVGGVVLNLRNEAEARAAAERLATLADQVLVERMVSDGVAEMLVGIKVDPQFGQVLVLGAGGVMTEYFRDSTTLLPPFTADRIRQGIGRLKISTLLAGYRGKAPGDIPALVEAILAVTRYAAEHLADLAELDVNPIIVRPAGRGVVAVDSLIRLYGSTAHD
jgi:acetyl-CoA synthetase